MEKDLLERYSNDLYLPGFLNLGLVSPNAILVEPSSSVYVLVLTEGLHFLYALSTLLDMQFMVFW